MSSYASTANTVGGNMYAQGGDPDRDGQQVQGQRVTYRLYQRHVRRCRSHHDDGRPGAWLQQGDERSLAQLNQGLENLKTGNQLKLMGAEGRITQQLIGAQGMQQRLGIRETGRQQRAGYREQGRQERMNIGAARYSGASEHWRERRRATRAADRWSARAFEHRRSRSSSSVLGIQTAGQEERKNIGKRYREERHAC